MMLRKKNKEKSAQKQNNVLQTLRKKVVVQAIIAFQTIIITVALIFGMSTAWYTNVLQSGGLQFEAEAWGFTGEVMVSTEPIKAGPGDSDMIGLTVTNMGAQAVDIALNASKSQMDGEMQKRLFFYVDAQQTRAGEAMERVYINTRDSFTYSVLGYGELIVTPQRANDASLKWHWVYDMLGYYFLGTVSQDGTGVNADVSDYLRPVEYDLDKAVFKDGVLESVDGKTVEDVIAELSATDGYEGQLVPVEDLPGYYQVDVDENGYGIWMYLCNWAQIQQATTYDSNLGKEAADALLSGEPQQSFIARLTVIGQVKNAQPVPVSSVQQLQEQLLSGGTVALQNNLALDQSLILSPGEKTMLDLNGYTLTGPAGAPVIKVTEGTDLTVVNGRLDNGNTAVEAISIKGGSLTLQDVDVVSNAGDAVYISDAAGIENTRVRIFGSRLSAKECAVYMRGNGEKSAGRTQVFIENSELSSDYITIMGNGTATYWGTEVQLYQSTLYGKYAAVYQPQSDSLTRVVESTLSGICGIVIKGGDLDVVSSTITGTGDKQEPKVEGSGYTDTGDALFVDTSYKKPITVTVSGDSKFISTNSYAVQVFEPEGQFADVVILGGEYSSDVSQWLPEGYVYDNGKVVQGGTGDE